MAEDMLRNAIELRVEKTAQLFHSLDPYPSANAISTKTLKTTSSTGQASSIAGSRLPSSCMSPKLSLR